MVKINMNDLSFQIDKEDFKGYQPAGFAWNAKEGV